uniref:DDE Tnp4 domain-containing protein n=1 Tax=Knipowitschia caucasica TaxID=637954 RepID=A0AAV2JKC6_KNICA
MNTSLDALGSHEHFGATHIGPTLSPHTCRICPGPLADDTTDKPSDSSGSVYNDKHVRTRSIIERTIGILKGRWMCLDTAGGKLLYKPEKVCRIIMAYCVLHNIAMKRGVPLPLSHYTVRMCALMQCCDQTAGTPFMLEST